MMEEKDVETSRILKTLRTMIDDPKRYSNVGIATALADAIDVITELRERVNYYRVNAATFDKTILTLRGALRCETNKPILRVIADRLRARFSPRDPVF